jgi:membrane protein YdbS with pleckstrin-like domain
MFRLESVLQMKDEENIRVMVRRHLITLAGPLLIAMLLIVVPFFLLFPLFSLGIIGVLIFGALIAAGIALAFRSLYVWDADVLIVTNLRVVDVDQQGFFSRHVSEAPLSSIQDVSWNKKGIWQTLFRMGSIKIQTAGATAVIEAAHVPQPEKVHEVINDARQEAPRQGQGATPVQNDRRSRIKRIMELLEQVDDNKVVEIESILQRQTRNQAVQSLFEKTTEA